MSLLFTIRCSDGWCDITAEVEAADPPWTLVRPEEVGAFQFSVATYQSGRVPDPPSQDLLSLLHDFGSSRQLGAPTDVVVEDADIRFAAGSFRFGDDFLRVWYVSDGQSFAKVTYAFAWGARHSGLLDCERMIRTLRFEYEERLG